MIVDASVWVAGALEQDRHHATSVAFLRRLITAKLPAIVPVLAWPEIAGAVARRTGIGQKGINTVNFIASQAWVVDVPLDATLASESTRLAAALQLRGADAVYVALAAVRSEPLITLDNEMQQRSEGTIEALTPERWLAAHG